MSETNPEDAVMTFGKYRGQTLGDILANDPRYLDWLNSGDVKVYDVDLLVAIAEINEKYSGRIQAAVDEND